MYGRVIALAVCLSAIPPAAAQAPKKKVADLGPWLKQVATLPAEEQVKAVGDKLKELNKGFDGQVTHKIADGKVVEIGFKAEYVADISPLRALPGLEKL